MDKERDHPLLFLDLETTGHDPLKRVDSSLILWHEIIDIGAVAACSKTLAVLGEFDMKIKPRHPERCIPKIINHYPERAARGEWDNASSLSSAFPALFHFCGQVNPFYNPFVLVGENFFFDWSFMIVGLAECGIDEITWTQYWHYSKLDTRSMGVQETGDPCGGYDPSAFSLRHGTIQKRLGLRPEPVPHRGITGAYQAFELYKALRKIHGQRDKDGV